MGKDFNAEVLHNDKWMLSIARVFEFFENIKKFGNSFMKNDIICMNLLFIYKKTIILSLWKIVMFKFTMYMSYLIS